MTPDLPYRIRRSDRARRVRVSVDAGGEVEVVLPRRTPERAAAAAIVELRPWIDRRLAEASAVRAQVAARGDALPYLGRELALRPQAGRSRVHRRGDELLVPADERAEAAIERW
jgi:predicted metal-dependent hydrolase